MIPYKILKNEWFVIAWEATGEHWLRNMSLLKHWLRNMSLLKLKHDFPKDRKHTSMIKRLEHSFTACEVKCTY